MSRHGLLVLFFIAIVFQSLTAQNKMAGQKSPATSASEQAGFGKFVDSLLPQTKPSIDECENEIRKLRAWSDDAYSKYQELSAALDSEKNENDDLRKQNSDLGQKLSLEDHKDEFLGFLGLGVGIAAVFLIGRIVRCALPLTTERKQLIVLVSCAAWISVVAVIGLFTERLSRHPVNLVLTIIVYSLPAISFSGIAFWWLGRVRT